MGIQWNVWYRSQPTAMLAEMVRRDWEMAAAHGETAFGSRVYNPRTMDAVTYLNREAQAPVRFMILIETHRKPGLPELIRQLYTMTGDLTGLGNDMMWMGGVASGAGIRSFRNSGLGVDPSALRTSKSARSARNRHVVGRLKMRWNRDGGWRACTASAATESGGIRK